MDVGYVALLVLAGVIALAVLWGVFRISPLALLRIAFPYPLYDRRNRLAPDEPRRVAPAHLDAPAPPSASSSAAPRPGSIAQPRQRSRRRGTTPVPVWPHRQRQNPAGPGHRRMIAAMTCALSTRSQPGPVKSSGGGLPAVTIDDDGSYTAINAALRQVRAEGNRRLAAMKAGTASDAPLTIILDEYKTLARVCPDSARRRCSCSSPTSGASWGYG